MCIVLKCPNCGRDIPDDSIVCEFCGAKLGENLKLDENTSKKKRSIYNVLTNSFTGTFALLMILGNTILNLLKAYYLIVFGIQYVNIDLSQYLLPVYETALMKNAYLYPIYLVIMIFVYISLYIVWRNLISSSAKFDEKIYSKTTSRLILLIVVSFVDMLYEIIISNFYGVIYPPMLEDINKFVPFICIVLGYAFLIGAIYNIKFNKTFGIDFSISPALEKISEESGTVVNLDIKESLRTTITLLVSNNRAGIIAILMIFDTLIVLIDAILNTLGRFAFSSLFIIFDILEFIGLYLFWNSSSSFIAEFKSYSILKNMEKPLIFLIIVQAIYMSLLNDILLILENALIYLTMSLAPIVSYIVLIILKYSILTEIKSNK